MNVPQPTAPGPTTAAQTSAPPPTSVLFARGVIARLALWSVLRIAVQESWGGGSSAAKRTWIASSLVDAFEQVTPTPDDQYVEEMLLQIMADEFEAVLEDGSAESVAVDVVRLWDQTKAGKEDLVLKFEEMAEKFKGRKVEAQVVHAEEEEWDDEDDGEDSEEEEEEVPQLMQPVQNPPRRNEPEVDEDGFTLVKGRGKGRR